ncbi:MAG: hypothetical protein MUC96_05870 [Myxococcaceae bacterium]|nr:hypothetical protein [Myxococcaceae bacterium]
MSDLRFVALVLMACACQPALSVGRDDEVGFETSCGTTAATVECPAGAWGEALTFASPSALQARLVGQWAFCGGTQRYTGRDPLLGFFGGAGVEFWEADGTLRFAYLRGPGPYVRRQEPLATGTVRLSVEGGRPRALLVAADGVEAPWQLDVFDAQPVLRNSAFEVWHFIAVP